MTENILNVLADYEKEGWVIVALPPELADEFVGQKADALIGLEFSARIHQLIEITKWLTEE